MFVANVEGPTGWGNARLPLADFELEQLAAAARRVELLASRECACAQGQG